MRLRVLFILVVLAHHRRRVLHFNVTEHPTAAWTAQQVVDAFPDDSAPSCLLHDRDSISGDAFRKRVNGMGISEVRTAPHSPWQNPFAERLIGSIRRECLDHVVVLGERHLRRTLTRYFAYYHRARTHLSLDKDAPDGRPIERTALGRCQRPPHTEPPGSGKLSHPGSPILSQAGSPILSHPGSAIWSHPVERDRISSSFSPSPEILAGAYQLQEVTSGGTEESGDRHP